MLSGISIKVLSESTGRVNKREKFFAYTSIASLEEYVLVAQTDREVTKFRRVQWKAEKFSGARARVVLSSLKVTLPLSAIHEGLLFSVPAFHPKLPRHPFARLCRPIVRRSGLAELAKDIQVLGRLLLKD